jgi:hypothetical protein
MALKRINHWDKALHDFVDSRAGKPFAWGSNDCALFVCDAVQALTETDIASEFRDKYTTQLGAVKLIREVTGSTTVEDVAAHVTQQFEMKELPSVLFAQRGDVVLFDGEEGPALGIVYLDGRNAVFVGEGGLHKIAVSKCRRAWRLGN